MKAPTKNPAITRHMAALKRAQHAPQKHYYPNLASIELRALVKQAQAAHGDSEVFSSRELTLAYVREFDRMNNLKHVEPEFAAPEVIAAPLETILTDADFVKLTMEQAGQLSPDNARAMLGHWWMGGDGESRAHTEEGRQQIHRTWLRHTFNSDASTIPLEVLESHALELPDFDAHCWFARQIYQRQQAEQVKPQAVAVIPEPRIEKAVGHATPPRKQNAKPKAPPPVRDVWFYLTRTSARGQHASTRA